MEGIENVLQMRGDKIKGLRAELKRTQEAWDATSEQWRLCKSERDEYRAQLQYINDHVLNDRDTATKRLLDKYKPQNHEH